MLARRQAREAGVQVRAGENARAWQALITEFFAGRDSRPGVLSVLP